MLSRVGMRLLLSFILALAMLVPHAAAQDDIENMLQNPDFEVGLEGWTMGSLADGAAGMLSIDKKEKSPVGFGQVLYARIDGVGNDAWEPEVHSPAFDVENGKMYTCSFWAMTEAEGVRPLTVKFEQLDTWTGPSQNFNITDEWQEYHLSPVMTMGSPPQVVLHIAFNNVKDDVWFSHFRVYEGEYVEDPALGQKPKIAVESTNKLVTAWGQIKSK